MQERGDEHIPSPKLAILEDICKIDDLFTLLPHCLFFQFGSVAQSCLTLSNSMICSTPGFPVHHQLPELAQTYVHRIGDAIQPSHPLLSSSFMSYKSTWHPDADKMVVLRHQSAIFLVLAFQIKTYSLSKKKKFSESLMEELLFNARRM